MKKIAIFYFSGTGNTLKVGRWISAGFANFGGKSSLIPIELDGDVASEMADNEAIGILSPTHGFNLPWIVLRFLWNLPQGNGKLAFVANTRAGMRLWNWHTPGLSGVAIWLAYCILRAKNYKILSLDSYDMPSNWISIHPALSKRAQQFIYKRCEVHATRFAERLFEKQSYFPSHLWIGLIFDFLIAPLALGYILVGRFLLAKTFIYNSKCNSCEICANHCPVKAIEMHDGKPYWAYNCESCMRCMNFCPHRSIETMHGAFFFMAWGLSFIPVGVWLGSVYFFDENTISWIDFSFFSLIFFLIYPILNWTMHSKWLNKFVNFFSLTAYWKRYHAEGVKVNNFTKIENF